MRAFLLLILMRAVAADEDDRNPEYPSNLVSELTKGNWDRNIVYSPVSVKVCLALVYLGAEGNTAAEMRGTLKFSTSKEAVVTDFLNKLQNEENDGCTIKVGNTFFLNEEYVITEQFKRLAKTSHLEIESLVSSETKENKNQINNWVADRTNHLIEDVITLDDNAEWAVRTALINEVYFKAKWENAFPQERTHFVSSGKSGQKFPMMVQDSVMRFGVLHDFNAFAALLKLQGTDISMLVLRPKHNEDLQSLEEQLTSVDLTQLPKYLYDSKVTLMLPKFKIETDIALKRALQKLKMRSLFYGGDFSGILASDVPLTFTDVRHKTILKVDEEGIEVASFTGIEIYNPEASESEVLNHNFFFALMDKENVYFAGHVGRHDE